MKVEAPESEEVATPEKELMEMETPNQAVVKMEPEEPEDVKPEVAIIVEVADGVQGVGGGGGPEVQVEPEVASKVEDVEDGVQGDEGGEGAAEVKPEVAIKVEGGMIRGGCPTPKAMAIWSEDIVLDPGNVRFPIRVVLVDDNFQTRFDRLVQLPRGSTTYIYRVLDHGIPWQHLDAGLTMEEVKKHILSLCKGKVLVLYDAWKTIGLFDFSQEELLDLNVFDLKANSKSLGPKGQPSSFWELVRNKLNHVYSGKPGNYDTIELTDFVMSVYQHFVKESPKE